MLYPCGRWLLLQPRTDRDWIPQQAVVPDVRFDDTDKNVVWIENIRSFTYQSADDFEPGYYDRRFDLDRIESIWLALSQFDEESRGPAHSAT